MAQQALQQTLVLIEQLSIKEKATIQTLLNSSRPLKYKEGEEYYKEVSLRIEDSMSLKPWYAVAPKEQQKWELAKKQRDLLLADILENCPLSKKRKIFKEINRILARKAINNIKALPDIPPTSTLLLKYLLDPKALLSQAFPGYPTKLLGQLLCR